MKYRVFCLIFYFLFFLGHGPKAQTVGLIDYGENPSPGYTLFSPTINNAVYLIDECGQIVNEWNSIDRPGMMGKLTSEGKLIHAERTPSSVFTAGGIGGIIRQYSWEGDNEFSYFLNTPLFHQHHDIEILPNGNILVLGWELIKKTTAENAGRMIVNNIGLYSEKIIEIKPIDQDSFELVWQWRAWDHLIQNIDSTLSTFGNPWEHPEKINLNFTNDQSANIADWLHANSLDYNPELDQIIINIRNFGEFWIIDHSTTSEEAASDSGGNSGMGGDLLYRYGNPYAYGRADKIEQKFFGQHDAHWIDEGLPGEGDIMVFNNGINRPDGSYSTIETLTPPWDGVAYEMTDSIFGPPSPNILYGQKEGIEFFYSMRISGAQRLPNGNTLICKGTSGVFHEINENKGLEWFYINPHGSSIAVQGENPGNGSNSVFQVEKYPYDFIGFQDKDMTAGEKIELQPIDNCKIVLGSKENTMENTKVYVNQSFKELVVRNPNHEKTIVELYDMVGTRRLIRSCTKDCSFDLSFLYSGAYIVRTSSNNMVTSISKIIVE